MKGRKEEHQDGRMEHLADPVNYTPQMSSAFSSNSLPQSAIFVRLILSILPTQAPPYAEGKCLHG
jgi:hypothetical protein